MTSCLFPEHKYPSRLKRVYSKKVVDNGGRKNLPSVCSPFKTLFHKKSVDLTLNLPVEL